MRRHGWQLPYHPLQVVAVAVFLALGFAFYVFFAPFVGRKLFQYIVIGLYTPLIFCSFGLYIWCVASDPADPGVFRSKKYLHFPENKKHARVKESKLAGDSTSPIQDATATAVEEKPVEESSRNVKGTAEDHSAAIQEKNESPQQLPCYLALLAFFPSSCIFNCSSSHEEYPDGQMSEDGMFYCSLCEVEVFKYSKHCRVCDKCVDYFDHHCRWLNNCVGKRNYRKFFTLMVSSLLLLMLQWSTGILVLIFCFIEHKKFTVEIASKLGSSFTVVPFVIVVAVCTILAMIATLPLAQLFFFHILLMKKGISTYDYIIALREQEQQGIIGQQSPHMSPASSLTGLSSASSFNTFQRGAWCTPPRLFLEDQFDVIPPDTGSVSSLGKKSVTDEPMKKNTAAVKISPWTLARLNGEEISKAAAEARKRSKILQPVARQEGAFGLVGDSSSGRRMIPRPDNNNRRRASKRIRLPADLPFDPLTRISNEGSENMVKDKTLTSLAPLQLEARSAFRTSRAMSNSAGVASSPESSLDSPDLHPFRVFSSGHEETRHRTGPLAAGLGALKGMPLSRSTSDGYEASGGEDSDQVPSRIVHRPTNWTNVLFGSDPDGKVARLKGSSSSSQPINRKH